MNVFNMGWTGLMSLCSSSVICVSLQVQQATHTRFEATDGDVMGVATFSSRLLIDKGCLHSLSHADNDVRHHAHYHQHRTEDTPDPNNIP